MPILAVAGKALAGAGKAVAGAAKKGVQGARKAGSSIKSGFGKLKKVGDAADELKQRLKKILIIKIAIPTTIFVIILAGVSIIIDSVFKTSAVSIKNAASSGKITGDQAQINRALELQEKYGSNIGFTVSQISQVANLGLEELDKDSAIYSAYTSRYGTLDNSSKGMIEFLYDSKFNSSSSLGFPSDNEKDISEFYNYSDEGKKNDVISIYDKKRLYEHILNTEKYGFNKIVWDKYTHESDEPTEIKKRDLKYDSEYGLLYPDDSSFNLNDMIDMVSPYLMTSQIPLAYASASTYSSNKSTGLGKTSVQQYFDDLNGKNNSIGDLAYQVIRHGLSDITVNQYNLKSYEETTFWREYERYKCNDKFRIRVTVNIDEDGNEYFGSAYVLADTYEDGTSNLGDSIGSVNTRMGNDGKIDYKKEEQRSSNTSTAVKYKVGDALAFDVRVNNSYNYKKYSDEDAQNRVGENSHYGEKTTPHAKIEKIGEDPNSAKDATGSDNHITLSKAQGLHDYYQFANNASSMSRIESTKHETKNDDGEVISYTIEYNVTSKEYYYQKGNEYEITRLWSDTIDEEPMNSSKVMLSISDVIAFDENEDESLDLQTIESSKFKEDMDSVSYYNNLATSDDTSINTVDILNSNPKVCLNYMIKGQMACDYVGLTRADYAFTQAKSLISKYFTQLMQADSNETKELPFVYGCSLGFDVGAVKASAINNNEPPIKLLKNYLRTFMTNSGMVNEEGIKVYDENIAKSYVVSEKNGKKYVGWGIVVDDLSNDRLNEIKTITGKDTIEVGDFIDKEIIDKIEDDILNERVEKVATDTADMSLTEYQIHALVARYYDLGDAYLGSQNGKDFSTAYSELWNQETDDIYADTYKSYVENGWTSSQVLSKVDAENELYKNYLMLPEFTSDGLSSSDRRLSEYTLFSMGYYSTIKKFYSRRANGPGDINLYNADGSVNEEACIELQAWYEQNIFDGTHPDLNLEATVAGWHGNNWGKDKPVGYTDRGHNIHVVHPMFKGGENGHDLDHNRVGLQLFQCTWWAESRAGLYLSEICPQKFENGLPHGGYGDGGQVASGMAKSFGVTLNMNIHNVQPNSIISWANGSYGHVAYVEAVDSNYIYISQGGGGHAWYGVQRIPYSNTFDGKTFSGSVSLDEIANKY